MKFTIPEVEAAIGKPFKKWKHACHHISSLIVKSDLIEGPRRVARGWCTGVSGQHSWVVIGTDCYAEDAKIIDPTLWSYVKDVEGIWYGSAEDGLHRLCGAGSIWDWGYPATTGGEPIYLEGLDKTAQSFIDMIYPLDRAAWQVLLSEAPVGGWPVKQIYTAAWRNEELKALIPIDRLGMLTDVNPGGLYLPGEEIEYAEETEQG